MDDGMVTTEEAARFLKLHPKTVQRMCRAGEIPVVRVGKLYRIRRADLESMGTHGPGEEDAPTARPVAALARIVAVCNQKGGVAKTTTTQALGSALAERGQRVLLVDLDPQASLTEAAGIASDELEDTIYTAMTQYVRTLKPPALASCLRTLGVRLDLLPANIDLAAAEFEFAAATRREYMLAKILSPIRTTYDIILIDCPPSLGLLTVNALTAATEVLIPLVPEYLPARGLRKLLLSIRHTQATDLNPALLIRGAILTMVSPRLTHMRQVADAVREHLGDQVPVLGTIKRSISVSEASAAGEPITDYARGSDVAVAYEQIAEALLSLWGTAPAPRHANVPATQAVAP